MARVVVFSLSACPHCKRAKALLDDLNVAYEDISLTDYPEKRTDMLQLADRLTVPQIFVGGHHVGGASDLSDIHTSGKLQELLSAPPTELDQDPRLTRPTYEPQKVTLPDAPTEPIMCIGGECLEYPELQRVLLDGVEVKDHKRLWGLAKTLKKCFTGRELADFLEKRFLLKSRAESKQAASQLLQSAVFSAADGSNRGFSDDDQLFRFQAHTTGMWTSLNTMRKWCTPDGCISEGTTNPLGMLKRLKGQLSKVVDAHTDSQGMVDYVAVAADPAFGDLELAVTELQSVEISTLPPPSRRAFVINLYNMIVPHAFAKVGIANKDLARVAFFDGVKYTLGGHVYSLNDLENGILRGNRTAPYHLRRPFHSKDERQAGVLPADYRIHFALNCGAKSCPPVKWFTSEAIEEELRVVAQAWVESEENVSVDMDRKLLRLSKIVKWYSVDFGTDKIQVAKAIAASARGRKLENLQQLVKGPFTMKYNDYDWSTNSSKAMDYSEICLRCFVE
eukprot:TRINITY_DN73100_c0_g1_i1.p1 TRINITY_DN73100_c0_g1~~TRINITY_DN73100_c0_g1_i1.p1  ORF type:complete len:506 (-),score=61.35 TRINITY_DN73100_c0_g1_i1:261-1778(-)